MLRRFPLVLAGHVLRLQAPTFVGNRVCASCHWRPIYRAYIADANGRKAVERAGARDDLDRGPSNAPEFRDDRKRVPPYAVFAGLPIEFNPAESASQPITGTAATPRVLHSGAAPAGTDLSSSMTADFLFESSRYVLSQLRFLESVTRDSEGPRLSETFTRPVIPSCLPVPCQPAFKRKGRNAERLRNAAISPKTASRVRAGVPWRGAAITLPKGAKIAEYPAKLAPRRRVTAFCAQCHLSG